MRIPATARSPRQSPHEPVPGRAVAFHHQFTPRVALCLGLASPVPKGCASESTLLPSHVPRTNLTSARPSLMSLRTFPVEMWPHGRRLPPQTQDLTVENLPEAILEGYLLASFLVVSLEQPPRVSHQPRPCGHGGVHRHGETSFQFEPQTPDLSTYSVLRSSHRTDALAAEPWRRLNLELNAVRNCPQWDPVCQRIQRRLGGHLHDCLHMGHPFDERSAERREVRILVGCRGQRRAHWFLCRHQGWCRRLGSLELWRLDTFHWSLEMRPCTTFSHHAPGTLVREILPLRYRLGLHVVGCVPQARLRVASEVPARPLRGRDETKAQLSCPTLAHRTSSVAFACHRRCRRPRGHLHQEAVPVVEICSTRPQVHTLLGRAAFLE